MLNNRVGRIAATGLAGLTLAAFGAARTDASPGPANLSNVNNLQSEPNTPTFVHYTTKLDTGRMSAGGRTWELQVYTGSNNGVAIILSDGGTCKKVKGEDGVALTVGYFAIGHGTAFGLPVAQCIAFPNQIANQEVNIEVHMAKVHIGGKTFFQATVEAVTASTNDGLAVKLLTTGPTIEKAHYYIENAVSIGDLPTIAKQGELKIQTVNPALTA